VVDLVVTTTHGCATLAAVKRSAPLLVLPRAALPELQALHATMMGECAAAAAAGGQAAPAFLPVDFPPTPHPLPQRAAAVLCHTGCAPMLGHAWPAVDEPLMSRYALLAGLDRTALE
jgi:hypothetical protein